MSDDNDYEIGPNDYDKWHWARPIADGDFECARVDYRDGVPFQVWFTGMSKRRPANECLIGPEIEPMKESQ